MVRSAATLLAFAAAATAVNQPPPVPEDAQIGLLAFPVTCTIYGFIQQTFKTVFTATAPILGGAGQQIYYTDVVGNIDVPSSIVGLAPLVGGRQASANVTVYLNLENASPANLLVFNSQLKNISFPATGDANIRIPQGNGTLPPLGPVTLGQANKAHRITLGNVDVSIEIQDGTGKDVFGPIPVHCGQQNINYIIGSVDVDSSTGPPFAPANGFVPTFPPTPNLFESGSFRFPYDCNFGAVGNYPLDLEISGTIPTYFAPGQQFSLSNAQSFLRVPTNLTTLAKNAFPSATTFHTTISEFDILFQNASPATFNVAKSGPIVSDAKIPASGQLIIPVPATGSLNVGPVTAGANGQIVGVAVGNANATIEVRDASGKTLFTLPATCKPPAPLELIGVPITTQIPSNYSLGMDQNAAASSSASAAAATATGTKTGSAATASATGSICFDDGDCILSGGKCVKAAGQLITGNCSK